MIRPDRPAGQPFGQPGDHLSDVDLSLRVNPGPITSVRATPRTIRARTTSHRRPLGVRSTSRSARWMREEPAPALLHARQLRGRVPLHHRQHPPASRFPISLPLTDRIAMLYSMRYDIDAAAPSSRTTPVCRLLSRAATAGRSTSASPTRATRTRSASGPIHPRRSGRRRAAGSRRVRRVERRTTDCTSIEGGAPSRRLACH